MLEAPPHQCPWVWSFATAASVSTVTPGSESVHSETARQGHTEQREVGQETHASCLLVSGETLAAPGHFLQRFGETCPSDLGCDRRACFSATPTHNPRNEVPHTTLQTGQQATAGPGQWRQEVWEGHQAPGHNFPRSGPTGGTGEETAHQHRAPPLPQDPLHLRPGWGQACDCRNGKSLFLGSGILRGL